MKGRFHNRICKERKFWKTVCYFQEEA